MPTNLDRRRPLPSNEVFEAHDWHDPTNGFLHSYRDVEDGGVYVTFCSDPDLTGSATIHNMMWINADQCEEFGSALLEAAKIIRARQAG